MPKWLPASTAPLAKDKRCPAGRAGGLTTYTLLLVSEPTFTGALYRPQTRGLFFTALGVGITGSILHVEGRAHFCKGVELFHFNARRNAFQKNNSGLYFGAATNGVSLQLRR